MEPTQLSDEPNNSSFKPNTAAPSEPSADTSYREPVDLDAMMRGEEPAAFSSIPQTNEEDSASQAPQLPDTTIDIPETSVARTLRKKGVKSPISRGAAPHLTAIAGEIKREKEVVDPKVIKKETVEGDPLFASNVMSEKKQAVEESKEMAQKRKKEATARGHKKAEDVGNAHKLKSLRTFESDIAAAMKGEKTSMVQMVLAEHNVKKEKEEIVVKEEKARSSFMWGSVALIILSVGVIATGAWYVFTGETILSILEPKVVTPIFIEKSVEFEADKLSTEKLRAVIAEEIGNVALPPDAIEYLYLTELIEPANPKENPYREIADTERFSTLAGNLIPPDMLRALKEEHMFGIHAWNGNQVFLLFFTNDFDNVFSGMLKWEKDLPDDFLPLIGKDVDRSVYNAPWEDYLVKNRDMRVLRSIDGAIVLAYTFFDRDTLIISTSIETIDEVIARVIQKRREP
ncbi:MAG: hypothetical protein H8D63_03235 [Parcubacteria group bacterium]|nr:hypothetical protein [Parcubacteria group bacterium]